MVYSDKEWLTFAVQAALKSPDPSTQNGALFLNASKEISVVACNTFPNGVESSLERFERPMKYNFIEHAERNAIYLAARQGISTSGGTLFVPWYACSDCARAIIQCGIKRVVGSQKMMDGTPQHWKESISHAMTMLEEAAIDQVLLDDDIGIEILFNGSPFRL